jgi:hypothetical protein
MDPEGVELFRNAELVGDRKIDAFTLRTVAQGGVIYFNLGFHTFCLYGEQELLPIFAKLQMAKEGHASAGRRFREATGPVVHSIDVAQKKTA